MSSTVQGSRPRARPTLPRDESRNTHTVRPGDTLVKIAQRHGVETNELHRANPQIRNPDVIYPGQRLQIPERQPVGGSAGIPPALNPYQDGASRFERGSNTSQPRPGVISQDDANRPGVQADPALATEVGARRASQNAAGPRGALTNEPATPEEKAQPPSRIHADAVLPGIGEPYDQRSGQGVRAQLERSSGRGGSGSSVTTSRRHSSGGDRTTVTTNRMGVTDDDGNRWEQRSTQTTRTEGGQSTTHAQRTSTDAMGNTVQSEDTTQRQSAQALRDRVGGFARNNTSATGVLGGARLSGDRTNYSFVEGVGGKVGGDLTEDRTGAAASAHALGVTHEANAGAIVNLKSGDASVLAAALGRADLVGASGRAQVGTTTKAAGAAFVEGEAHVGARGQALAGVTVNLKKGSVRVGGGAEAFVGAEVRGTVGYENRYGGVAVTGRGQIGAGASANASFSYQNGSITARADLGAAFGLGGRVTVDLNANVGALASDVAKGAQAVANNVAERARAVGSLVSGWFD